MQDDTRRAPDRRVAKEHRHVQFLVPIQNGETKKNKEFLNVPLSQDCIRTAITATTIRSVLTALRTYDVFPDVHVCLQSIWRELERFRSERLGINADFHILI